jgi:hypothetical protein
VKRWEDVHSFYAKQGKQYSFQKLLHALAAVDKIMDGKWKEDPKRCFRNIIESSIKTKEWMTDEIEKSREKDYRNPFRQMVYENMEEMKTVLGPPENNSFVNQEKKALETYKKTAGFILKLLEVSRSPHVASDILTS